MNSKQYNISTISVEINPNDVQSSLSSDGVLTITAPRKQAAPENKERVVPITQTGPSSTSKPEEKSQASSDEQTSKNDS